jgi:hypothetical protein
MPNLHPGFLVPTATAFAALLCLTAPGAMAAEKPDNVYSTYGVHNPPTDSPCADSGERW